MTTISFTIPGPPTPKERARFGRNQRTGKPQTYTPDRTAAYEAKVAALALLARQQAKQRVWTGPVMMKVTFWLRGKRTGRPDLTNALKSIEDGCNGVIYEDDAQVVSIDAGKFGNMESASVDVEFKLLELE